MCLKRVSVDGPEEERTDVRIVRLAFLTSVVQRALLDSKDCQRPSPSPSPQILSSLQPLQETPRSPYSEMNPPWAELREQHCHINTSMCKTGGKLLYSTASPAGCSVMT